jgi:triacylglycerol lipase
MPGQTIAIDTQEVPDWSLPIWRESLLGVDWCRLRASCIYYGVGVPRGDRSAVVVIPGFLGHDFYLAELFFWLWRIGYRPYMSRIGHNADCPNLLIDRLLATMERAHEREGTPVHLIGHSLGGVLALCAAAQAPEMTGTVITLGAPFRGPRVHPLVLKNASMVRNRIKRNQHRRPEGKPLCKDCFTYDCACGFACSVVQDLPEEVPHLAVYSRTDGIVDWASTITGDEDRDAEVRSTHCGMAWNPEVYRLIAKTLKKHRTP